MKFLVIRFSSIGDIVLTTAAIRCLKQQVPDAEIHFLTKQSFKDVTLHNPYISQFHYFNDDLNDIEDFIHLMKFLVDQLNVSTAEELIGVINERSIGVDLNDDSECEELFDMIKKAYL